MKRKINLIVSLGLVLSIALSSCGSKGGSKGGASSGEKALQNFAKAHMNKDIEGMCNASAPKELWDYICDDAGLSRKKLIYKIVNGEENLNKSADSWKKYFEEEKMKISDFKIKEESESDDELYTVFNRIMKSADIDETVDKVCDVESNYKYGFIYEIDGDWYYGPEWLIENVLDIAYDGYDNWNDENLR